MNQRFAWGHININVRDLDASIDFYRKLGFKPFIQGIPYLNLTADMLNTLPEGSAAGLGIPAGTRGRACIMQLDDGFPKIDLTELDGLEQREPLSNLDRGIVRLCLISQDLAADYERLEGAGVRFLSAPQTCQARMADIATCVDPDGTLIELLQVYLDRWPPLPSTGV
ncbi:MAG: VOC family protein [Pseudomonadales bacterium]